jgi:hypothetical protein
MTAKTAAQITTEIASNLADNTTGAVTPALLRQVVQDMVDSVLNSTGLNGVTNGQLMIGQTSASPIFKTLSGDGLLTNNGILTIPNKQGFLFGLTLSAAGSVSTFGVAAGAATDSLNGATMPFPAAYTKTTSVWAVGTGNGALDTGAIANSTWYYVFLIQRTDTGVTDILFSLSPTSPTMPASYTLFRRIGAMKTDGSAHWIAFSQVDDLFLWSAPVGDINDSTITATSKLYTISVPTGIKVKAMLRMAFTNTASTGIFCLIQSPDESTQAANTPNGNFNIANQVSGQYGAGNLEIRAVSGQIRAVTTAGSNNQLLGVTYGWSDSRGRMQ